MDSLFSGVSILKLFLCCRRAVRKSGMQKVARVVVVSQKNAPPEHISMRTVARAKRYADFHYQILPNFNFAGSFGAE